MRGLGSLTFLQRVIEYRVLLDNERWLCSCSLIVNIFLFFFKKKIVLLSLERVFPLLIFDFRYKIFSSFRQLADLPLIVNRRTHITWKYMPYLVDLEHLVVLTSWLIMYYWQATLNVFPVHLWSFVLCWIDDEPWEV